MKLRLIAEKRDKDFFSYDVESKDMWGEKIKEAKDEFDVDFNTENDDSMDQQRVVEVPGDVKPAKFACEMYSAGGDWEFPLRYFRCELKDGYIEGRSKYSDPHFVFVPDGEQGNGQLTKTDKGTWVCPDSDFDDEEELRDEKKCWESLKTYLKELVDKEITEARKKFQIDPEMQAEIAQMAAPDKSGQSTWFGTKSKKQQEAIVAQRKASRAETMAKRAPEIEAQKKHTRDAKKHAKLGLQAQRPKNTAAKRDQKAIQAAHKQNRTLPESTCSRAPQGTSRHSRQSVVLLGIPSHKKPLQLRHIAAIGYSP